MLINFSFAAACGDDGAHSTTPLENNQNANNGPGDGCATGERMCGGSCVDTSTNSLHCGSCDTPCEAPSHATATCAAGGCEFRCEAGFVDRDGDLGAPTSNGCEAAGCEPTNGGVEICDGLDNNCNGTLDEGFSDVGRECSVGVGRCAASGILVCGEDGAEVVCSAVSGRAQPEICGDSLDNDCDGDVDESDAIDAEDWYADQDGDGFGDDDISVSACEQPAGHVGSNGDCDDANAEVNPDAAEICDDVDNDCSGEADETFANKGDACSEGVGVCRRSGAYVCSADHSTTECSASAAAPTEPGAELTCDDLDNNCDASVDEGCDDDLDGWCDGDMTIAGNPAVCSAGVDASDCDDADDVVYPSAPGLCDDKDNDCNGAVDDIRLVRANPTSVNLGGAVLSDDDMAQTILAVPTGNDGFCVARVGASQIFFYLIKADGAVAQVAQKSLPQGTFPYLNSHFLLDVDWYAGRCAAVIKSGSASATPDYELRLATWESTTSTIHLHEADSGSNFATGAALYHAETCGITCVGYWYVAFIEFGGSDGYRLVYRVSRIGLTTSGPMKLPSDFDPTLDEVLDPTLSHPSRIVLGPSPGSAEGLMVGWYNTSFSRWVFRTIPEALEPFDEHSGLLLSHSGPRPLYPHIGKSGSTVYLAMHNPGRDKIEIRQMKANYTYGYMTSIEDGTSQVEFLGRYLFAPPIDPPSGSISVFLRSYVGWYVNPYSDILYPLYEQTSFSGARDLHSSPKTNQNASPADEYLAVGKSGDYLQFLRMTSTNPTTVEIDEMTCY
jgi:hypothetical protein